MGRDGFSHIIAALGKELKIELTHTADYTTKIILLDKVPIFIRHIEQTHQIEIMADLGVVPPGLGRERVLTEALKVNGIFPQVGIMAYSSSKNALVLWHRHEDTIPFLLFYNQFIPFTERALLWHDAIKAGFPHPDYAQLLSAVPKAVEES
jgi:hypothetical protein